MEDVVGAQSVKRGKHSALPAGTLVVEPEASRRTEDYRVLDLTDDGLSCVPVLERQHRKSWDSVPSPLHVHRGCMEIIYCQRGELVFESMGKVVPFRPGMVVLSRPDEPHRLQTFPRGMLTYGVLFRSGKPGTPVLGLTRDESDCLRDRLAAIRNRMFPGGEAVRSAFQRVFRICDEEPRGTTWRTLSLRMAVLQLLMSVIDASSSVSVAAGSARLQELVAAIRAHPEHPVSVDDLAARCHQSPGNFARSFKKLTGLPPLAFRNTCRIERAKRLLVEKRLSLERIALDLGYSSRQNFATSFRLATDCTPSAWRARK